MLRGLMNSLAGPAQRSLRFPIFRLSLTTAAAPHHADLLADQAETIRTLFREALPNAERDPTIPDKPASFYEDDIEKKMATGRASLASLHRFCETLTTAEEANKIPNLLKLYTKRGVSTTERTASCIVKAACRAGVPEVALKVIADRQSYRLFPTVRAMNFLMYRFLIDGDDKPEKLPSVLKTYKAILKHERNPTDLSREFLVRSMLLEAKADEKQLETLVKLCEPSSKMLAVLPHQGISELAKVLKSQSRQDLLKSLKDAVDQRKKKGETINPYIKSALE